jgi:hypothetical protein
MCAANLARLEELNSVDGSEALFKMYLDMGAKEDKEIADRWKADAKGIILFVSPDMSSAIYTISTQMS